MRIKRSTTAVREIDYVNDPLRSLYRRRLPSAIGSLLTATAASLIDAVILSHYLGPGMLAVVSLCMPVYMLINTLGMMIASGAEDVIKHHRNRGRFLRAHLTPEQEDKIYGEKVKKGKSSTFQYIRRKERSLTDENNQSFQKLRYTIAGPWPGNF